LEDAKLKVFNNNVNIIVILKFLFVYTDPRTAKEFRPYRFGRERN